MALIIIFMIGLGIYMSDFISENNPNHYAIYDLHKSIGVLVIILVLLRIVNRFIHKPLQPPIGLKKFEKTFAKLGHFGLYVLMIVTPVSGYLMSSGFGFEVKLFGIALPAFINSNIELARFFKELHELSAFTLAGLIVIHILAVIKHRYFDAKENDVLNRML